MYTHGSEENTRSDVSSGGPLVLAVKEEEM